MVRPPIFLRCGVLGYHCDHVLGLKFARIGNLCWPSDRERLEE